jgi:hypothetical protein
MFMKRSLPLLLLLIGLACTTNSESPPQSPALLSQEPQPDDGGPVLDLDTSPDDVADEAGNGVEPPQSDPASADPSPGELVFVDRGDWQGWRMPHPEQAGVDTYGKWLRFDPAANAARSPEFPGARLIRARFQIYFPPRFPFYVQDDERGVKTDVFSLLSTRDAGAASFTRLDVNLTAESTWRIQVSGRRADGGEMDSGDQFEMPWAFDHGWNHVNWVVLLREPGAHEDAMRIQIGSKIFAWTGLDLSGNADPLRYFRVGGWEVPRGDRHLYVRLLRIEDLAPREGPGDPPVPPPPPPPPPPSGALLYEENFDGENPFHGWRGRNVDTNLQVESESGNQFGRLIYQPHSDWRVSFLPRHAGVFDLVAEYSVRLPLGYRYRRYPDEDPRAGEIIGGGKHFWMLQSCNQYDEGREAMMADGVTRLDFGARGELGDWAVTAYRNRPGGERPGEFARRFRSGQYFTPGRWHRVRCELHLNPGPGDNSGRLDLYVDDEHLGTFTGEFNVVGARGGIRVLGFGNLDNLEGEPWVDVDNIRITAR